MKMCSRCYKIQKEPKIKSCSCKSKLVNVDDAIAESISLLNKTFLKCKFPFRTIFSCSGHQLYTVNNRTGGFPYLAIGYNKKKVRIKEYLPLFVKPMDALNFKVLTYADIIVTNIFCVEYFEMLENETKYSHQLNIGGFTYTYKGNKSDVDKLKINHVIQHYFDMFLIDLIKSIKLGETL